ncbi:MAG: hypothetical protein K5705_00260 [Oscillospiraceae bacterium]|nr:hypothetical protein [Oscillospiraceae bacterium]
MNTKRNSKKKIYLISSSGGHYEQLQMLKPLGEKYNIFWVITAKISSYVGHARKYLYPCIILTIVLGVILVILKRSAYWTGTALFTAGALMTVPTAVVLSTDMIQRFSLKDYTTYHLVTGVLNAVTKNVMITGIVMLLIGVFMIVLSMVTVSQKQQNTAHGE